MLVIGAVYISEAAVGAAVGAEVGGAAVGAAAVRVVGEAADGAAVGGAAVCVVGFVYYTQPTQLQCWLCPPGGLVSESPLCTTLSPQMWIRM